MMLDLIADRFYRVKVYLESSLSFDTNLNHFPLDIEGGFEMIGIERKKQNINEASKDNIRSFMFQNLRYIVRLRLNTR